MLLFLQLQQLQEFLDFFELFELFEFVLNEFFDVWSSETLDNSNRTAKYFKQK